MVLIKDPKLKELSEEELKIIFMKKVARVIIQQESVNYDDFLKEDINNDIVLEERINIKNY